MPTRVRRRWRRAGRRQPTGVRRPLARAEDSERAGARQNQTFDAHLTALDCEVDHRRADRLPLRPERQSLITQRRSLPRPVERQTVVAAPHRGRRHREIALFQHRVVPAVVDQRRARLTGVVRPAQGAGQCGPLEGDGHRFGRVDRQSNGRREGLADPPAQERHLRVVGRVLAQVGVRRAEGNGSPAAGHPGR